MKRIPLFLIGLFAFAASAHALDVSVTKDTKASPAEAWKKVGEFCAISSWHPAVAKCELSKDGDETYRTLTLGDGGQIFEKLVSRDDDKMTYTYTIEKGPLPVKAYTSTISVTEAGDGSTIGWTGTFEAEGASDEDATKVVTGIYEAGLDELSK